MHWASRLSGTRTDGPDSFVPALNLSPEDRFGTALPLFHVYGQAVVLNTCLGNGCLRPRGFGPVDFAELRLAYVPGSRRSTAPRPSTPGFLTDSRLASAVPGSTPERTRRATGWPSPGSPVDDEFLAGDIPGVIAG